MSSTIQYLLYKWLKVHENVVHSPQQSFPKKYIELLLDPNPELMRGAITFSDPEKFSGATAFSKAFFLLNRHRSGTIQFAEMTEDLRGAEGRLKIWDSENRGIVLSGCSSGYGGEGPSGTLYVLRLSGFPDGPNLTTDRYNKDTRLEHFVRASKSFRLDMSLGFN